MSQKATLTPRYFFARKESGGVDISQPFRPMKQKGSSFLISSPRISLDTCHSTVYRSRPVERILQGMFIYITLLLIVDYTPFTVKYTCLVRYIFAPKIQCGGSKIMYLL